MLTLILTNLLIIGVIFGYSAWMLTRFIRRSKEGKCAACAVKKSCEASSCAPPSASQ